MTFILGKFVAWIALTLLVLIVVHLGQWWRRRGSESWPEVESHVETATWDYSLPDKGALAIAKVGYSYVVNGERYADYWSRAFQNPDEATDFVRQVRNRRLLLRYRPDKPERSIVLEVIG